MTSGSTAEAGGANPLVRLIGQLSNSGGVRKATERSTWPARGFQGVVPQGQHDERVDGEAGGGNPLVRLIGQLSNSGGVRKATERVDLAIAGVPGGRPPGPA